MNAYEITMKLVEEGKIVIKNYTNITLHDYLEKLDQASEECSVWYPCGGVPDVQAIRNSLGIGNIEVNFTNSKPLIIELSYKGEK